MKLAIFTDPRWPMHHCAKSGRTAGRAGAIALLLWAAASAAQQPAPLTAAAREALVLCRQADGVPASQRSALLAIGLGRAEAAVNSAPRDAVAHFAVFCNLGKRLQMNARGLGLLAELADIARARREIDVALAIAPDYSEALAAKGEMLVELPRLLGGDPEEGARLLRRSVALTEKPKD